MGMMVQVCKGFGLVVVGLIAVLLIRTATFPSMQPEVTECKALDTDFIQADKDLKRRFQEAIKIQTISWSKFVVELDEVAKLHLFLEESFPLIHTSPLVTKEVINGHSLLYTVKGSDPSLMPYMLAAHQDVVPVKDQDWKYPPFEAREDNGYIYGRGTIDDKHSLMGIMEALEFRLKLKQIPIRTMYLAFGHDEEVYGKNGAGKIAEEFMKRGIKLDFILDEGGIIVNNVFKGLDKPIGIVCVAEKGILTLNLSVEAIPTGHSSMPTPESNIGILTRALSRLEYRRQPIFFGSGPEKQMFEHLASEAKFPLRFIITNMWFFRPLFGWVLTKMGPSTNAFARTTTAITMVHGGFKTNVLPPSAWAIVNHRIHPSQSIQQVIDHDRSVIGDDRVKITVEEKLDASPTSPFDEDAHGYQVISHSIRQVFPSVLVTPGVMIGNTDTRYYWNLTNNIYRFTPTVAMGPEDLKLFHGINERISVDNYEKVVNYYYHVMQNADKMAVSLPHSHSQEL
ncbi:N-fatty-acyl-amino acid synthase/hydrolase PM20D1-like [Lytechinus variegatus]|uniref:N-fatty-acyl-amino acid synthase/hydrolase PM20D1-like n=1 Tax=Lytechinus variegatus TaxID=7654 RepID=UPI001BB28B77|nr:N-fatty-acyl-amino acid synthase/hydrolase PM20D1-like [Lytechinus variegatus]XP_041459505.1 N-fatty-acyl-amino acid synthase/hydrolase PM20D1-like [Lytechinus variegatus]